MNRRNMLKSLAVLAAAPLAPTPAEELPIITAPLSNEWWAHAYPRQTFTPRLMDVTMRGGRFLMPVEQWEILKEESDEPYMAQEMKIETDAEGRLLAVPVSPTISMRLSHTLFGEVNNAS